MSENNRRARFYSITRAGKKQLSIEADLWSRTVAMMARLLEEGRDAHRPAAHPRAFGARDADDRLDEEVRAHLDLLAADYERRGHGAG